MTGKLADLGLNVFISHRRSDSPYSTLLIYHLCMLLFGEDYVFWDYTSIKAGDNFRTAIKSRIQKCDFCLVVIGDGWLESQDDEGNLRLKDPEDFVRIEIQEAYKQRKRVVPVLVDNAKMPGIDDLHPEIGMLANSQAIDFRFGDNMEKKYLAVHNEFRDLANAFAEARDAPPGERRLFDDDETIEL